MSTPESPAFPVPPPAFSRGNALGAGRTLVMGVLNVTPDSFSDGGNWSDAEDAIKQGLRLAEQGADIVDVGGESTRPGARRVTPEEEWERIGPVVEALVRAGVTVSIDTVNSQTARAATDMGAALINDVSGGVFDPKMAQVCSRAQVAMVVQHWRGFPSDPDLNHAYGDPVREVIAETQDQVHKVLDAGVSPESIVIDPGLGFALSIADSWAIANHMEMLTALGYPVLIGASRKRFVADRYGRGNDALDRGTLEVTRKCVETGVWGVRVHDVQSNVSLIRELHRDHRSHHDKRM